jgi:hypothetical protein
MKKMNSIICASFNICCQKLSEETKMTNKNVLKNHSEMFFIYGIRTDKLIKPINYKWENRYQVEVRFDRFSSRFRLKHG